MGIFDRLKIAIEESQKPADSVYERRVQRGEISADPEIAWKQRTNRLEAQKKENESLTMENRKLRRELERLQGEMETMNYVHSIDDLIDTMAQKKSKAGSFNPFATWGSGGAADGGSLGDKVLSQEIDFFGEIPEDNAEFASDEGLEGFVPEWDEAAVFRNSLSRYVAYWDMSRMN